MLLLEDDAPFHTVLDKVHKGRTEPTPVGIISRTLSCPLPNKSNTGEGGNIIGDPVHEFQQCWWRGMEEGMQKRFLLL